MIHNINAKKNPQNINLNSQNKRPAHGSRSVVIGSGRCWGDILFATALTPVVGIQSLVPWIKNRCHFHVAHTPEPSI